MLKLLVKSWHCLHNSCQISNQKCPKWCLPDLKKTKHFMKNWWLQTSFALLIKETRKCSSLGLEHYWSKTQWSGTGNRRMRSISFCSVKTLVMKNLTASSGECQLKISCCYCCISLTHWLHLFYNSTRKKKKKKRHFLAHLRRWEPTVNSGDTVPLREDQGIPDHSLCRPQTAPGRRPADNSPLMYSTTCLFIQVRTV